MRSQKDGKFPGEKKHFVWVESTHWTIFRKKKKGKRHVERVGCGCSINGQSQKEESVPPKNKKKSRDQE